MSKVLLVLVLVIGGAAGLMSPLDPTRITLNAR